MSQEKKQARIARCPICKGAVLISIYPRTYNTPKLKKESDKEWLELMNGGCNISIEEYNPDEKWCHHKCQFRLT